MRIRTMGLVLVVVSVVFITPASVLSGTQPQFAPVQEELFGDGHAYTNAIADYDNDGDLDIFVGFSQHPNRLYRNDDGTFLEVGAAVGVADNDVTRAAAWGDYNGDGHMDLFVGFVSREGSWNRLYKNEGNGERFTDVTEAAGVGRRGGPDDQRLGGSEIEAVGVGHAGG